jgi:anaerobic selenocysteine-containing dehydrogenase
VLRGLGNPHQAAFYTSGRLSNEATFLYQLWVREFGTNNLPDCSNMCHEASGRALTAAICSGKGTVDLADWEQADAIWLMGDNAATNAPRMLTWLAEADRRGAELVHINPLIEAASRRTIVPHEFADMATFRATKIGTRNVQVRIGGDMALLRGMAKVVFETAAVNPAVLDGEFLDRYTRGLEEYRALCETTPWSDLVHGSGVTQGAIRELAHSYIRSGRVIIAWCLGVTQHEHAVDTIREIVNVLLLRGNIGREGAGPCPVRGHSNVQGNRTCGINHRPDEQFLDRLAGVCHIDISYGMKQPASPHLRSECTILAGLAQTTLPGSNTPWQWYVGDYDRIRDTMAQVLDGFEDFNARVRHPHGFRLSQPARERGFLTSSGRAEFGLALRRRHPQQRFTPLRSAEPPAATDAQHAELTLTAGPDIPDAGLWIKDLDAGRRRFAARLADRQSLMIPAEDPDYGDLGQAFPTWTGSSREAILQPPKPQIRPPARVLERAADREADIEAGE